MITFVIHGCQHLKLYSLIKTSLESFPALYDGPESFYLLENTIFRMLQRQNEVVDWPLLVPNISHISAPLITEVDAETTNTGAVFPQISL